tara:strand:- start:576 stop:1862 length:1287 start_codon:yes stop_codon:yes gene_type:complete
VNKFYLYFLFLLILSNCSFVGKEVKKIEIQENKSKNIFKNIEPTKKELNTGLIINIKKLTKGKPFLGNNSNNSGNINFETNFENKSVYKFSSINQFKFIQPELIFTDDNCIIFFDGKGNIFKINEDLKKLWEVNNYSKKERKLDPILYFARDGKNLIVSDTLSKYYSINLENGELLWSKSGPSPFNSNIKVYKDRFLTVDYDNVIRAFSIENGEEIWNFPTENSFIKSQKKLSLILKNEVVYFINNLGDITALNVRDGSLVWQTPTQSNVIYQNAFTLKNSDIIFANKSIYFSNNKNEFFSIDLKSGIIKWKQNINSSLRPTVIENLVFSISEEGYLFVIDDQTGNIIRITNTLTNIKNKKNNIKPIGFIVARNKIYLSLNNGRLIKINISNGLQDNIYKLHGSKISRPYVFNGNMYLIKENGIIKLN